MTFYQFAFKNLLRNRSRTLLTIVSIVLTTTILLLVLSLDKGFKASVKDQLVDGIGAHLIIARGGCPMDAASIIAQGGLSPMFIPESIIGDIENIEGIRGIMPFKTFAITTSDGSRTDIFCGITEMAQKIKSKWKYNSGGWFKNSNSIIMGADIAKLEKRNIGDKIYIEHFDKDFVVSGILEYSYTQDDGMFFLPLNVAQDLINRKNKLSAIALSIEDLNQINKIKIKIKEKLSDDYMVLTPEAIGNDIMKFYDSTRTIMYAILFFMIIIATVGLANTMIMMIFERRKEIAYLKCVGASFSNIYKLILQETIILCSIGISTGLILGGLMSSVFESIIRKYLLTDYIAQTAKIIRPDLEIIIITSLTIMVIGLLAVTYPAIKVSKIMPMEAIRNG